MTLDLLEEIAMHLPHPCHTERNHWTVEYGGETYGFSRSRCTFTGFNIKHWDFNSTTSVKFSSNWVWINIGNLERYVTKRYSKEGLSRLLSIFSDSN